MQAIPIHQAKANLSKYIVQAKQGKPVYIGSYGKPEVMLVVVNQGDEKTLAINSLWGSMRGKATISDAEWDELDRQIAKDFEESADKDY